MRARNFLLILISATALLASTKKNILVLHPYAPDYEWTNQLNRGLVRNITNGYPDATIFTDYLDAKKISTPEYFEKCYDMLRIKYENISNIDLIITCDNAAYDLIKAHDDNFMPATPLVACGINSIEDDLLLGWQRPVKVFVEHPMVSQTVGVIKELFPNKKLAYIGEANTISGKLSIKIYKENEAKFPPGIQVEWFTQGSLEEICQQLLQRHDEFAILLDNYQRDDYGTFYPTKNVIEMVGKLNMPTFVMNYTYMGEEMIGGYTTEPEQEGILCGKFAAGYLLGSEVLVGQSVDDTPHNRLQINLNTLKKFGKNCSPIQHRYPVINKKAFTSEYLVNIIVWYSVLTVFLTMAVILLLINIIKRKTAETNLKTTQSYLDNVVKNIPGTLIRCDKNWKCVFLSESGKKLFNISDVKAIGEDFYSLTSPLDLERVKNRISRSIDAKIEFREIFQYTGTDKYYDIRLVAISNIENQFEGVVCFIYDISKEVKMRLEIEEKKQELERSNDDLQQFAYIASHDLQEPVRMVTCYLDLLSSECNNLGENATRYINFARDGAIRMNSLISDLLQYSRAGSNEYKMRACELNSLVEEVMASLRIKIEQTNATVSIGELPIVRCDHTQMYRLFLNLIGNALKYHKQGTNPKIKVSAEIKDGYWQIEVVDNGIDKKKE